MRYFIDVRDSWSVSRKKIELPIKNEDYIQRVTEQIKAELPKNINPNCRVIVPIVLFAITSTYHIICSNSAFSLFYDILREKYCKCKHKGNYQLLQTDFIVIFRFLVGKSKK